MLVPRLDPHPLHSTTPHDDNRGDDAGCDELDDDGGDHDDYVDDDYGDGKDVHDDHCDNDDDYDDGQENDRKIRHHVVDQAEDKQCA